MKSFLNCYFIYSFIHSIAEKMELREISWEFRGGKKVKIQNKKSELAVYPMVEMSF